MNQRQSCENTANVVDKTETDADDEKDINLNDFLDLLNVSCHLNSCIMNMKDTPSTSTSNTTANNNNSSTKPAHDEIDFEKLVDNNLVNELLGYKKKPKPHNSPNELTTSNNNINNNAAAGDGISTTYQTVASASGDDGAEASNTLSTRRLSAFGATASAYYTRNHQTKKQEAPRTSGIHPKLEKKLDYVINEGVLDSVLPFICPVPVPTKQSIRAKAKQKDAPQGKSIAANAADNALPPVAEGEKESSPSKGVIRRKSLMGMKNQEKKEPEVVIHVCDEVKNTSRDFVCQQSLLVSKMGYFADVTAGQKLEDMDISVHCDIQIFDWLMKWVKHSANTLPSAIENGPQLDASNVVPILVSASFLQMEPLLLDCLSFCHARLSEVVRSSTNLSCLNDSIISRLAAMFTNVELEAVRDKKDRVTPRLWTKLIQSLAEPETEALRGHYYSLAGLFRCSKCGKCLTNSTKAYINCLSSNMRLNRWGQLVSHHVRDSTWEINAYIAQLFKELKSWRKVYWKLWGQCHCLYCCICETHFAVYQMSWCRYHPEGPNYLGPVSEGRLPGPAGRYPCCGQQAFRFETLPGPNGCQFREHSVLVESDRERAILSTAQLVSEGNALCEGPPLKLQESIASGEMEPRWVGMPLTPQRCRQGLLPSLNPEDSTNRLARCRLGMSAYFAESSTETDTSDTLDESSQQRFGRRYAGGGIGGCHSSTSSDGCESDCSVPKAIYRKGKGNKKRQTDIPGRYWCGELSARSNQDHQREFEEKVMKQVIAIVNKKTGSEHSLAPNVPVGGSYLRLEAEWKEQLKQRNSSNNSNSNANNNNNSNATSYNAPTGTAGRSKAK